MKTGVYVYFCAFSMSLQKYEYIGIFFFTPCVLFSKRILKIHLIDY